MSAAKKLHELFASEWDYQLEQHPTWASRLGDRRWNDRWEDRSLDSIDRQHSHNIEVLAKLKAIDREALSPSDQLNYDLFSKDYENEIEGHRYRWYLIPINQLWGVQNMDDLANALLFERVKDYDDWLARLRAFPDLHRADDRADARGDKTTNNSSEDCFGTNSSPDRPSDCQRPKKKPLLQTFHCNLPARLLKRIVHGLR